MEDKDHYKLNLSQSELDDLRKRYEEITTNIDDWSYPKQGGYTPDTHPAPGGFTDTYRESELANLQRRVFELERVVSELTEVLKFFKPFLSDKQKT